MVVNRIYYRQDTPLFRGKAEGGFRFDNEALEVAIRRIYEKEINTVTEIEQNLFRQFWKAFNEATDKGFGTPPASDPDRPFYEEIRYNNAVFSAFRTHRFQNDIARQMLDENGKLKAYNAFKRDVEMYVAPTHLDAWLQTEYSTATLRAHLAADWRRFEANRDLLPNLRWVPSTSLHPGEDHRIFWDVVRPVDDPFWNKHRPGDRWNCKCDLEATDDPVTPVADIPKTGNEDDPSPGLENNPGRDAKLFSDSNPYVAGQRPGAKKAVSRFIRNQLADPEKYTVKTFKSGGRIEVPEKGRQNRQEEKKNLRAYTELAKMHGGKYRLLPVSNEPGRKNPDAINLSTGRLSDVKVPVTENGKNAIQTSIQSASRQRAGEVVIYLEREYDMYDLRKGLKAALQEGRAGSIHDIVIRLADGEVKRFRTEDIRRALE